MSSQPLSRQSGLSLIEVMIALAVLSVGILAVVGVFPSISRGNSNNWTTTEVALLAQETMDNILSSNTYVSTSPTLVDPPPPEIPLAADGQPSGYVQYVGRPDPGGNTNIQLVDVEVVWVEKGRVKKYKLTSAVSP